MGCLGSKEATPASHNTNNATSTPARPTGTTGGDHRTDAKAPAKTAGDDDDDEAEGKGGGGGDDDLKADDDGASGADASYGFWDRNKTVKPAKELPKGRAAIHKSIQATMKATLGGTELREAVKLPQGEDLNEWIAVNTVTFFNAANMIYGTCAEFCTEAACPTMSAGRNEYLWKDGGEYKVATKMSAPKYIDLLLGWVSDQISDPKLFPVDETSKFPRNFLPRVKDIYKRLFRLYAHIYWSHFAKMKSIGANAHLNTCFKHFVFFVLEFDLIDKKGLAPLEKFIAKFRDKSDGAPERKD